MVMEFDGDIDMPATTTSETAFKAAKVLLMVVELLLASQGPCLGYCYTGLGRCIHSLRWKRYVPRWCHKTR